VTSQTVVCYRDRNRSPLDPGWTLSLAAPPCLYRHAVDLPRICYGAWNLADALLALALILAPTLYRIEVEEKTLMDTFGDKYRQYMLKTWRLIPDW
jgi:hypothetical protein